MCAHDLLVYLRVSTFCVRTWSRCIVQDVLACVIPLSIGMRCLLSVCVHRHMCDAVIYDVCSNCRLWVGLYNILYVSGPIVS